MSKQRIERGTKRRDAIKVRSMMNRSKNSRSWLFYFGDGTNAFLGESKLGEMDPHLIRFLMAMGHNENRELEPPLGLFLVRARNGGWLVHRIEGWMATGYEDLPAKIKPKDRKLL